MKASEEWTNWKQKQEQRVNDILHFELNDKIRLIRDRWADLQIETTVPPMGEQDWDSMRIEIHTQNLESMLLPFFQLTQLVRGPSLEGRTLCLGRNSVSSELALYSLHAQKGGKLCLPS